MFSVRKSIVGRWFSSEYADVIIASWRPLTIKQYQYSWREYVLWCDQRSTNPFRSTEKDVIDYLNILRNRKLSYSVINTTRSTLSHTLPFRCGRMMKGCYNFNPPRVRYSFTWDVNMVLDCLCLLFISIGGFIFKGLNIEVDHFSSIGYCCQGSILVSTSLKIYA